MDHNDNSNWRSMFERGRPERPPYSGVPPANVYDDGHAPSAPLSPEDMTDEAALALAHDAAEYRPWVLQRGRGQPPLMLDLRRYDARSGQWIGWQVSYPHLVAVEYTGDKMLSLDFGTRQFVIEGRGLLELPRLIQQGSVLALVEYSQARWPDYADGPRISAIKRISDT